MSSSPEAPTWSDDFPEIPEGDGLFWPSVVFGVVCMLFGLYLVLTPAPPRDPVLPVHSTPAGNTSTPEPVAADGATVLRFAFVDSKDSTFAFAADAIARRVAEASEGRLRIETLSGGLVDGKKEGEMGIVKRVQKGEMALGMCTTAPLTNLDHDLDVLDLPFLFESVEQVDMVLEGEIGQNLLDGLQKHDLQGLGFLEVGFRIFSSQEPMPTLEDFQGKKLRVMQSATASRLIKALGGDPIPAPVDKIYKMGQEGYIDGAGRTYPTYWDFRLYEIHRYITETRHTYSCKMVLMNLKTFRSLSEEDQNLLREIVVETAKLQRDKQREADRLVKQRCLDENIEIFELSPEERKKFVDASRPLYEEYTKLRGTRLLEEIQKLK